MAELRSADDTESLVLNVCLFLPIMEWFWIDMNDHFGISIYSEMIVGVKSCRFCIFEVLK